MKLAQSEHLFITINQFLIATLISYALFFSIPMAKANQTESMSQEQSEAKLDQLKSSIKKMTSWLFQANDKKTDLNKNLEQNGRKINQLSKKIRQAKQKIKDNKSELASLNKTLIRHRSELKTHQAFLQKQIQIAYFQEEHSDIKLLLNTDNPQDIARQMRYFDFIKVARKEKIERVSSLLKKIKNTEEVIKHTTERLERRTVELNSQQLKLSKTLKNKQTLLAKLKKSIQNNTQRLEKMRADQARLKALLEELENSLVNLPMPSDSAPFSQQKSKLPWPSRGKVVAEYGSSVANGKLKLNGIRIITKENEDVLSIYSGRVIFSNWIRGFGLLIIIDHGNQFMSLYGNNKSLTKETGDWVRVGETIAISSEYTSSLETGLYFEIRKKGKPINPRKWLR